MSHELRTPLNAILGFSDVLRRQLYGQIGHAKYLEYAEDVHKSGCHLLDLVNDVLDLSKINAGKMELRESRFSVSALISDALMLVRDNARGRLDCVCRVPDYLPQVFADLRVSKQILLNLLSNAIKFTPDGGTVIIGAVDVPDRGLELFVEDTGPGMTETELLKAFSAYGQIDSRVARTHQGTGLGLPISKSLAQQQGGDITAESMPGRGTRMTFLIPEDRVIRSKSLKTAILVASPQGSH